MDTSDYGLSISMHPIGDADNGSTTERLVDLGSFAADSAAIQAAAEQFCVRPEGVGITWDSCRWRQGSEVDGSSR